MELLSKSNRKKINDCVGYRNSSHDLYDTYGIHKLGYELTYFWLGVISNVVHIHNNDMWRFVYNRSLQKLV